MRALIIGCGYVGEALGQQLTALGHDVTGIRRNSEHNDRLAKLGIRPINLDITQESEFAKLDGRYDWVVIAVSSSRGSESAYERVFGAGTRQIAQWLKTADASSVVFISSTTVYRQTNAEWVLKTEPTSRKTALAKSFGRLNRQYPQPARRSPFCVHPGFTGRVAAICSDNS